MNIKTILAGLVLAVSSSHAAAALVQAIHSQLPQTIQGCTTCEIDIPGFGAIPISAYSGTSAPLPYEAAKGTATTSSVFGYHYTNPAATSAEEADRWLIQYELHASSGTSGFDNYTGTIFDTDYSGFAWLDVPAVLDPTASLHRFTLYSEQVSPFGASGDFDPVTGAPVTTADTLPMYMTTIDAMAGSGFLHLSGISGLPPGSTWTRATCWLEPIRDWMSSTITCSTWFTWTMPVDHWHLISTTLAVPFSVNPRVTTKILVMGICGQVTSTPRPPFPCRPRSGRC